MTRQRLPTDPCPHCGGERFGTGRQAGVRYVRCVSCGKRAFVDEAGHDLGSRKPVHLCPKCNNVTKATGHNDAAGCAYRHCATCDTHWKHYKDGQWSEHHPRKRHRTVEDYYASVVEGNRRHRWRKRYGHLPHDFHVVLYYLRYPDRGTLTKEQRKLISDLRKGRGEGQSEPTAQVVPKPKRWFEPPPEPAPEPPPPGPVNTIRGRIEDLRLARELFLNDPLLT